MTEADIRNQVRAMIRRAHFASEVAADLKVSPQYLHDFLNSRRAPGKKLLAALGLKKVVTYQARGRSKHGVLD